MKFATAAVSAVLALANTGAGADLPPRVVDCHHHFLDFANNTFSSWLGGMFGPFQYLPENYESDVTEPLADEGVELAGTVHLEILPDTPLGGVEETRWIQELVDEGRAPHVKAIVASCDLGDSDNVAECLGQMNATSGLVRGIRWIVDYVGPFDPDVPSATHVNAVRKDVDYLRGGEDGGVVASFEEGYGTLADYGWSFDAQLAPAQLAAMADLAGRHPDVPVVINHLGKPRLSAPPMPAATNREAPEIEAWTPTPEDEAELKVWRDGMKLMADLPHTYVKLSMLGYAVPDWIEDEGRTEVVKGLVLETVEMFGPKRCMFGLNWFLGASISDNDGRGTVGPDPVQLTKLFSDWLGDYSEEDREWIFAKTAETAYRFSGVPKEDVKDEPKENLEQVYTKDGSGDEPAEEPEALDDSSGYIPCGIGAAMVASAGIAAAFMEM